MQRLAVCSSCFLYLAHYRSDVLLSPWQSSIPWLPMEVTGGGWLRGVRLQCMAVAQDMSRGFSAAPKRRLTPVSCDTAVTDSAAAGPLRCRSNEFLQAHDSEARFHADCLQIEHCCSLEEDENRPKRFNGPYCTAQCAPSRGGNGGAPADSSRPMPFASAASAPAGSIHQAAAGPAGCALPHGQLPSIGWDGCSCRGSCALLRGHLGGSSAKQH